MTELSTAEHEQAVRAAAVNHAKRMEQAQFQATLDGATFVCQHDRCALELQYRRFLNEAEQPVKKLTAPRSGKTNAPH